MKKILLIGCLLASRAYANMGGAVTDELSFFLLLVFFLLLLAGIVRVGEWLQRRWSRFVWQRSGEVVPYWFPEIDLPGASLRELDDASIEALLQAWQAHPTGWEQQAMAWPAETAAQLARLEACRDALPEGRGAWWVAWSLAEPQPMGLVGFWQETGAMAYSWQRKYREQLPAAMAAILPERHRLQGEDEV